MNDPLRVLVVDDEEPARARMRNLLSDIAEQVPNTVVGEAADGHAALEILDATSADVALVDIRMPRMDGIELAQHLAHMAHAPALVFVTAYDQYAIKAFDLAAVDYLLKPVRAARLAEALARARRLAPGEPVLRELAPNGRQQLRSSERGRMRLLSIDDVLYFKAELKYVTARTAEQEYVLEETLSQLEDEYAPRFIRIHRNCLVARDAITGCQREREMAEGETELRWMLMLRGVDERLHVSRRQWPQIRKLIEE